MQSYKKIIHKLSSNTSRQTKIVLLSCLLASNAFVLQAQSAKLQLEGNTLTIGEILNKIEQQTNYNIGYSNTSFDKSKTVTLGEPKETIAQVLTQALKESGYSYRTDGSYIFIEKNTENVTKYLLKGIIIDDETNKVIANASIQVEGHPALKARSNTSGLFSIKDVPTGKQTLRVVAENYKSTSMITDLSKASGTHIRVRLTDTRPQETPKEEIKVLATTIDTTNSAVNTPSEEETVAQIIKSLADSTAQTESASVSKETMTIATSDFSKKQDEKENKPYRPLIAQKVNLLYLATTSLNFGAEIAFADKWTLDAAVGYNPWKFGDAKIKHWLVMPELRYWVCQSFEGHFFGLHGLYSKFNVGNLSFISAMKDYSYQGSLYGAGLSYGYHFPLKGKWGLELTAGFGYVHLDYDKFECNGCKEKVGTYKRDYIGPTKAGVTLIYMLD